MNDEDKRYQKFYKLYEKALLLINEQYDDYKTIHGKTATLISLSAFIFPLILSTSNFKDFSNCVIVLLTIPILTYLLALILFSIILFPKQLKHGVKFDKIEESFDKDLIDILKIEIIALKKAFEMNKHIIEKQNKRLKLSIRLTLFSIGLVCILMFIGQTVQGKNESNCNDIFIEKAETFNNFKSNNMKIKDSLFCAENDSTQNSSEHQDTNNQESRPSVSESDLESFTKLADDDFEKK